MTDPDRREWLRERIAKIKAAIEHPSSELPPYVMRVLEHELTVLAAELESLDP